jgi:hypothetical protein
MDGAGLAILLSLAIGGCKEPTPPEFPAWVAAHTTAPREDSSGFQEYVAAAKLAEEAAPQYLSRVWFTPGMKENAVKLLSPAMRKVEAASRREPEFDFQSRRPFEPTPHAAGWRLIGRAFTWRIEQAVAREEWSDAMHLFLVSTKFGFDLTGGGAAEASLGLAIADDARRAFAPSLGRLQGGQLDALADSLTRMLESKPPMSATIEHERLNMLQAVQFVQDAYRDARYDELRKHLGNDIRPAIEYVEGLRKDDLTKRAPYFEKFAQEAEMYAKWFLAQSEKPLSEREESPRLESDRPWRRFSKHFFTGLSSLQAIADSTMARSRLLVIEASVLAEVRRTDRAPLELESVPDWLKTDPYTGKPFIYRANGSDYRIYSVGSDLRDNGGESDDTFTAPDLRLEFERG